MKYKKKPVIIEAFELDKFVEYGESVAPQWFIDFIVSKNFKLHKDNTVSLKTLEGWMTASPGDYIIQGVKGEIYSCRGDIFKQTYEPAE